MSVNKMPVDKMSVDQMSVDKMSLEKCLYICKSKYVDKMSVD